MPAMVAVQRGPILRCRLPPKAAVVPSTASVIVNVRLASGLLAANSSRTGLRNTLHPYTAPSASCTQQAPAAIATRRVPASLSFGVSEVIRMVHIPSVQARARKAYAGLEDTIGEDTERLALLATR